ncbi:MAG: protein kinase [Chloroflexi bacterium]|nr:protein kinase [Chloroflexota bacterium]
MSDWIGQLIGPYQIKTFLGQGSLGAVFAALDMESGRPVALKVIYPQIAAQRPFRKPFSQEAAKVTDLQHPNIVDIHAYYDEGELLVLVMDHIQGGSLGTALRMLASQGRQVAVYEALALTRQVAAGLDYAHKVGLVHQSVKPENILLRYEPTGTPDLAGFTALVSDFGMATMAEKGKLALDEQAMVPLLPYMSAEQIRDKGDARSDIYSLGIILYQLLTGRPPFVPTNRKEAIDLHSKQMPPYPSQVSPGLAPEIDQLVMTAIAKSPKERFQTGYDFMQAIERLVMANVAGVQPNTGVLRSYLASPGGMPATPAAPNAGSMGSPAQLTMVAGQPKSSNKPAGPKGDHIVIEHATEPAKTVPFDKLTLMIGRDPAHDIVLGGEGVSRNHARIDKQQDGSYKITDLGSTNGSFLDDAKLLSNVPEEWLTGKVLKVGTYSLRLNQGGGSLGGTMIGGGEALRTVMGDAPAPAAYAQPAPSPAVGPQKSNVSITINPPEIRVDPGLRADAQVTIFNQGDLVEHFYINVQGIPAQWVTIPPAGLQLMPGTSGVLPVMFAPPRLPTSTAGRHPFTLRISSDKRGAEVARADGILIISPFYQMLVDLQPKRVRKGQLATFTIRNQGNAPDAYTVTPRDREEGLRFFPPTNSTSVNPGQADSFKFEARPRSSGCLGIGSTRIYPLEVQSVAASGEQQVVAGELVVRPTFPIWLLMILFVLCLLLLLLLLLFWPDNKKEPKATPNVQPITLTNQSIRDLLTATFQSYATLDTQQIITATAAAQQDNDDDGLTNAEERALGTNPDEADSDFDGLDDGDEVKQDTDPQDPDSDDDGLVDGKEVEMRADPGNPDSDNDGLTDGDEVNSFKTLPTNPDTDGDGLNDRVEVQERQTDPTKFDTDGDGVGDSQDQFPTDPSKTGREVTVVAPPPGS